MTTHQFTPTRYYVTLGSHEPALRVADGDTVITTTVDSSGNDGRNEHVTPGGEVCPSPVAKIWTTLPRAAGLPAPFGVLS